MPPRPINSLFRARLVLALILLCAASSAAHAFYLINPLSYWPASNVSGNIVFQVGLVASPPNVPNPPLTDGSVSWDAAFVTQMDAWNALLPDNVLVLQAITGSAAVPAEGDNVNNVFFSGTVYGDSWGSSTAGICLSFWSGNVRTEADVLFNSTKTWNAYTGNLQGGTTDFRRVCLHELGHALLLDHPDDVGQSVSAIMNSVSSNTDALTTDDIAAVTAVFGALTPVTITTQPRASTSTNGTVSLNVTAAGSEPITYQWQRSTNGGSSFSNLAGVTFPNGSAGSYNNGDQFRVVVTNQLGSVTSRAFTFTIAGASAPTFVLDPASATINEGDDVIFTANATGSPTPAYQWQFSSNGGGSWQNMFSSFGPTDVTGITSPSLRITHAISAMNGYQFRAVANPGAGAVNGAAATLTVTAGGPAPYFTWQPLDVYAQSGANAMIVAGTSGSPAPTRQWQRSINGGGAWSNLANDATFSGVATSTLTITGVTTGMTGHLFRLNLTNGSGNATSRVVTLSVGASAAAPTITDDPDNVILSAAGQTAAFTTAVTALPAPVFHWEISSDGVSYSPLSDGAMPLGTSVLATVVSGANTRALTVANVVASLDGFRFRLVARNASGSATSAVATVTISAGGVAPSITTHPSDTTKLVGENATFTAAATGTPTPTLQWQRSTNGGGAWNNLADDVTFSGVTTGTLTVTGVTLAMSSHQFRIVATNTVSSANSNAATLTVHQAPAITTQPADASKLVGENATFTAAASTGTPTPTLQWQRSVNGGGAWNNLANDGTFSGVTTGTLTVTSVTLAMNGHQFRMVATNTVSSANSNAATLAVSNVTPPGQPGTPTVSTTAYDSLTAQWSAVSGATGYFIDVATDAGFTAFLSGYQNLDLGNVTSRALTGLRLGTYYVRVRAYNGGGSSTSSTTSSINVGSRLINLSTRGQTSNADPMIVGFYTSGSPKTLLIRVGSSRVDLQACKLEYSIVSPK